MSREVVRYSARDAQGRPETWAGVRHYTCPNGCSTAFYDFRKARLYRPGVQAGPGALVQAVWILAALYVALGLIAVYGLFMYGVTLVPAPVDWARQVMWALVTVAFATTGALLVLPPRRRARAPGSAPADGVARTAPGALTPAADTGAAPQAPGGPAASTRAARAAAPRTPAAARAPGARASAGQGSDGVQARG